MVSRLGLDISQTCSLISRLGGMTVRLAPQLLS